MLCFQSTLQTGIIACGSGYERRFILMSEKSGARVLTHSST